MTDAQSRMQLLFSQADYSFDGNRQTQGLGSFNPLAPTVMGGLFDLGLIHAVINKRRAYASKKRRTESRHTFVLLLHGEMTLELNGTVHDIAPGDLAYYPVGTTVYQSSPGNNWHLYMTFEDRPYWGPLARRGVSIRQYESAELMYLLMDRIASAFEDPTAMALDFAERDARMLTDLLRREVILATRRPPRHKGALRRLVEQIREEPETAWTLASMADDLNVSIRTLIRLFLAEYGVSPIDMVVRERMSHAYELIAETDMKVASVAQAVGYESVPSFSRLFKKHFGKSPGKCRDRIT